MSNIKTIASKVWTLIKPIAVVIASIVGLIFPILASKLFVGLLVWQFITRSKDVIAAFKEIYKAIIVKEKNEVVEEVK